MEPRRWNLEIKMKGCGFEMFEDKGAGQRGVFLARSFHSIFGLAVQVPKKRNRACSRDALSQGLNMEGGVFWLSRYP